MDDKAVPYRARCRRHRRAFYLHFRSLGVSLFFFIGMQSRPTRQTDAGGKRAKLVLMSSRSDSLHLALVRSLSYLPPMRSSVLLLGAILSIQQHTQTLILLLSSISPFFVFVNISPLLFLLFSSPYIYSVSGLQSLANFFGTRSVMVFIRNIPSATVLPCPPYQRLRCFTKADIVVIV